MKFLFNKEEPTRAIIIALNKDSADTLKFMFDNHMVFGFYQLSHRVIGLPIEEQPSEWIKTLEEKYGIVAHAIGHFQCVEGFVEPEPNRKEIPEKKTKPEMLQDLFNFLG